MEFVHNRINQFIVFVSIVSFYPPEIYRAKSLYTLVVFDYQSLFFFGFQIPEKTLIAYLLSEYTIKSEPSGTEQTALIIASISIRLLVV